MTYEVTDWNIKVLCGQTSFRRGKTYYYDGSVTFNFCDIEGGRFEAKVRGNENYEVQVEISPRNDEELDIDAECTCPAFYAYDNYCKHIAAVLVGIQGLHSDVSGLLKEPAISANGGSGDSEMTSKQQRLSQNAARRGELSAGDEQLATGFLHVFDTKRSLPARSLGLIAEVRSPLQIEFICKVHTVGYRKSVFGLEMKAGTRRLYIVQKIKAFLEAVAKRESYYFSQHFTYDPQAHVISGSDDEIIRHLLHIFKNEKMMREMFQPYSTYSNSSSNDRLLLVPPLEWERLLPLLTAAPSVRLEHEGQSYERLNISDEPIPVQFEFDQSRYGSEGYQLQVTGMDALTIMEAYNTVIAGGRLVRLNEESFRQLMEIKQLLGSRRDQQVQIQPQQMEPFMEKVVPGLMKLGQVQIATAISDRIVRTRLQARLYLDRIRDRLVAGLEFQYGDIIINPLEDIGTSRGHGQILVRDGDKEQQIFSLMEQAGFISTESGYFMEDEEAEFEFLYHAIPELEKLLLVHATSAVKARLYPGSVMPIVKADVMSVPTGSALNSSWTAFQNVKFAVFSRQ